MTNKMRQRSGGACFARTHTDGQNITGHIVYTMYHVWPYWPKKEKKSASPHQFLKLTDMTRNRRHLFLAICFELPDGIFLKALKYFPKTEGKKILFRPPPPPPQKKKSPVSGRITLTFLFIFVSFSMKRCSITAKIAGSIGMLSCCVLNDLFHTGVYERLPELCSLS